MKLIKSCHFKESCYLAENAPPTDRYAVDIRTVGRKRVMAGLLMGCLPLAEESDRYTPPMSDSMFSVLQEPEIPVIHVVIRAPVCPNIRRLFTTRNNTVGFSQ